MKTGQKFGLVFVVLALIFSILACGGGAAATATPVPTKAQPTAVPTKAQPTATKKAAEPTATEKAAPKPTKPAGGDATGGKGCEDVEDGTLDVAYVHGFVDSLDSWRVIGLVCNKTNKIVSGVELEVEIFDKDGKSLYKQDPNSNTSLYYLAPGEESPFVVWITEDLEGADSVTAKIAESDTGKIERAAVEFKGVTMLVDDNNTIHISGEVVNNGKDPVDIGGLAGAAFDGDGKMVAAAYASVDISYLDAGDSGPFRVSISGPEDSADIVTDYKVYVDARVTDEKDSLLDAEKDMSEHANFKNAFDNFYIVGELTNNGEETLKVYLVAAIYDKDDNVLDAASTSLPIAVEPGEVVPYSFSWWGPMNSVDDLYDQADSFIVYVDKGWTYTTDNKPIKLATDETADANEFDKYQGKFTGKVVNDSGGDIDYATVVVSIHDKDGQIIAMGYSSADIEDVLKDGDTADYEVYVPIEKGLDVDTAKYMITVVGTAP